MGYVMNGLGAWYNPADWFKSAPDDAKTAQVAGNIRYCKQLYQWTRQTRLWFNTKIAQARAVGNSDAVVQGGVALGKLLQIEDELAPYMQEIDEAERKLKGQGWSPPADWGFRWNGWQGDDHNPPSAPPAAKPITKAEAQADGQAAGLSGDNQTPGSAWWVYAIGAALLVASTLAFLAFPPAWPLVVAEILVFGSGLALTVLGSPGGQHFLQNMAPNIGGGIGMGMVIAAGVAVWMLVNGGRSTRGRR